MLANWGLVGAAVYDASFRGPEIIDVPMTATMIGYSSLFIRFAWAVQPRNYLLFACHTFNVTAQVNQLRRAIEYKLDNIPNAAEELQAIGKKAAGVFVGLAGLILSSGRLQTVFAKNNMPSFVQKIASHPAGINCLCDLIRVNVCVIVAVC